MLSFLSKPALLTLPAARPDTAALNPYRLRQHDPALCGSRSHATRTPCRPGIRSTERSANAPWGRWRSKWKPWQHTPGAANGRCNCCGRSWKVVQKTRLNAPASDRQASARQRLYRIASSVANHAWRGVAPRYRGRSDPDFAARAGRYRRSTCWSFEVHIVVPHRFGIRLGLVLPCPQTRTRTQIRTAAKATPKRHRGNNLAQ